MLYSCGLWDREPTSAISVPAAAAAVPWFGKQKGSPKVHGETTIFLTGAHLRGECESRSDFIAGQNRLGRMITLSILTNQNTVLYRSAWSPVKHPCAVVLHLRRHEVKVPRLVVRDPDVKPPTPHPIAWPAGWPELSASNK